MIANTTLPPFPTSPVDTSGLVPLKAMPSIGLRACRDADLDWLRKLYGDVREGELAATGLSETVKTAFLDSQFALQHSHYVTVFAGTDFLLIEHEGKPVGRLYLYRRKPLFLVVDISLERAWRNRGIGSALLRAIQRLAYDNGAGLSLHVADDNPRAQRLYHRLGFRKVGRTGVHDLMHWDAVSAL